MSSMRHLLFQHLLFLPPALAPLIFSGLPSVYFYSPGTSSHCSQGKFPPCHCRGLLSHFFLSLKKICLSNHPLKKSILGWGDAQVWETLLCAHEDVSLELQHPHKKMRVAPQHWGTGGREVPGHCCLASLVELVSFRLGERPCLKEHSGQWPRNVV